MISGRRLLMFGLLAALAAGCGGGDSSAPTPLQYVALGDSIAAGVGASTPDKGYVALFSSFLKSRFNGETLDNRSVSGFTSTDLLNQLRTDATTRQEVKDADVITISIGGNNLLGCINPLTGAINSSCSAAGLQQLLQDWPQIISEIRNNIGSSASIYVLNLYDPVPPTISSYPTAEQVVMQANAVFTQDSAGWYVVVDAYSRFHQENTCTVTRVCGLFPDPHPSDQGYQILASLQEAAFNAGAVSRLIQ